MFLGGPLRVLLLIFIVMPILEMWLLIRVGGVIGPWPTIGLVLLTAFIGLGLLRLQGAEALLRARQKLSMNEIPARELADGLFFAIGGALLLTPGFMTDIIGFACLTPGIRTWVIHLLIRRLLQSGHVKMHRTASPSDSPQDYIDGEFRRHHD